MATLTDYDTTVFLQSAIKIWLTAFNFRINSGNPEFKYANADILTIDGGYNNIETYYSATKIVDPYSGTVNKFIQNMAKNIFGSVETVSFLLNTNTLQTSIQNSLVSAAENVNDSIDANGSIYAAVTGTSSTGYKTVKNIYDSISTTDRLKLHYNIVKGTTLPASSTINNLVDSVNNANIIIKTDSNSDIIELIVNTSGSKYGKGDSVTFTDGTYSLNSLSITSYQAAGFNGTLETSDIEFPLYVGDIINITQTLNSSINEVDASGDAISVSLIVRFSIKLVKNKNTK